MRSGFLVTLFAALLAAFVAPGRACGASDVRENAATAEPCPCEAASVFKDGSLSAAPQKLRLFQTVRLAGTRLDMPTVSLSDMGRGSDAPVIASGGGRRSIAIAVAASAILPGLGELYVYMHSRDPWTLARVPAFMAVDGYLWYSYRDNHKKGKDFKRQYEEYADAHWSLDRFLIQHPCCAGLGGCNSWQEYDSLPVTSHCSVNFFIFTPREADREEYYENAGKYNAFQYGWDDWPDRAPWTPHRTFYWGLREDSDKYLKRGDQAVMFLIVNRVVSMIDAGWIAYRSSRGDDPSRGWSFDLKTFEDAPTLVVSKRF
jgi:hypothetical protein